ncbi:MAG TPA: hypothetical protein VNO81_06665 [Candidatus Nitrosotenuis sp.]|jgi:hypothetical protein|nr:hypothetical protein [Candidatus Nitrosotenuis sp.]
MGIFKVVENFYARTQDNWGPRAESYLARAAGSDGSRYEPKVHSKAVRQGQTELQSHTPGEQRQTLQDIHNRGEVEDSVELSPEARQATRN